jgi:RNase H-fold protein (predicted Holliday junction resolvase)
MRVLGLDMSTRKTGWAVFDNDKLIAYNLIEIQGKEISE